MRQGKRGYSFIHCDDSAQRGDDGFGAESEHILYLHVACWSKQEILAINVALVPTTTV